MAYDPGDDYNPGLGTLTKKSVSDVAPGQWGTPYAGALLGSAPVGQSLGFNGPVSGYYQGTGDSGGDMTMNPEYTKFLQDNGINVKQQYSGELNGDNYNLQGYQGANKVGAQQTYHNSNDEAFMDTALILGAVAGGGIAAAGTGAAEGGTAAAGTTAGESSAGLTSADTSALYGNAGYGAETSADAGYAGLGGTTAGGAPGLTAAEMQALPGAYASAPAYGGPGSAGAGAAGEGGGGSGLLDGLGGKLQDAYKVYQAASALKAKNGGAGGAAGGTGVGGTISPGDRFRQQLAAQALRDQASQSQTQAMPGYVPGS